jgi:hypothetical protein
MFAVRADGTTLEVFICRALTDLAVMNPHREVDSSNWVPLYLQAYRQYWQPWRTLPKGCCIFAMECSDGAGIEVMPNSQRSEPEPQS